MSRGNQRDRARRTIEAPNGVRIVLPVGTSNLTVLDRQLQLIYRDAIPKMIAVETPFVSMFKDRQSPLVIQHSREWMTV